jgi:hypothetical protein
MSNPKRLYGSGKVGAIVVLDYVSLGEKNPFAQYAQPAFFTIEARSPTPGSSLYTLKDSTGALISSSYEPPHGDISSYLMEVTEWWAWHAARAEKEKAYSEQIIETLRTKFNLLREILIAQGVRVVSSATETELRRQGIPIEQK